MTALEELLRLGIGLDPTRIGPGRIEGARRRRMAALGLDDPADYLHLVATSKIEFGLLVDQVTVPETWFLREPEALDHMVRQAAAIDRGLRILCLPCATGEESYSISMALLAAGRQPESFRIDAVDVSQSALAQATIGEYGKNSLRGRRRPDERYLTPIGPERWRVARFVRTPIRFRQGNLTDPNLLAGEPPYRFVFCRNLFIYLDDPTRRRAVEFLRRVLDPTGTVYAAQVECGPIARLGGLTLADPAGRALSLAPPATPTPAPTPAPALAPVATGRPTPTPDPERRSPRPPAAPPPTALGEDLTLARQLADTGQNDASVALCRSILAEHPTSVEALHLQAVVVQSMGSFAEAEDLLGRVLYLDPEHDEAILLLACLADQRGDERRSERLRARARRIQRSRKGESA